MHRIRVLIGILGLDQHEVGAVAVSRMLRDAGMEVIYAGRFNMPAMIVEIEHSRSCGLDRPELSFVGVPLFRSSTHKTTCRAESGNTGRRRWIDNNPRRSRETCGDGGCCVLWAVVFGQGDRRNNTGLGSKRSLCRCANEGIARR